MTRLTVVLIFAPFAAASSGYAEVTLENGYSQMYNLQFEEAHGTFQAWERLHAGDPMGPVSDAAAFLLNIVALTAIPSASVITATEVNPGDLANCRAANRTSASMLSSVSHCQASRLRSSIRLTLPNSRRAVCSASALGTPSAISSPGER